MESYSSAILKYLGVMAQDATLSSHQRQQATYAAVSFFTHRNTFRLMAQTTAISNGKSLIYPPHQVKAVTENAEAPVNRHGRFINAIVTDFRIIPTAADFEGHPIELISTLDSTIEDALSGGNRFKVHGALLSVEKKANEDLARSTRKYGYHYIFRAGLRQYYMTKTVVEVINFWGADPRGDEYRVRAQKLCYEAMEKRVKLNDVEKRILVQVLNCSPEDAFRLWNWLEKNRAAYIAMKACISLLDNLNCKDMRTA